MANKKIYAIASITLIILFLSFSLVSAGWFGDFWNKITGKVIASPSECGLSSNVLINDPLGDASPNSPSYVDIKTLGIKQIGQYIQFVWEANGSLYNEDTQYYFIFFDTDNNLSTGQDWGGTIGAEIKIIIDKNGGSIVYFDKLGNVVSQISNLPVIFYGNKFYISMEKSKIGYGNINLYFESSGATDYRDTGTLTKINIPSSTDNSNLRIKASNQLVDNPPLINIPQKNLIVQLNTYSINNNSKTLVPPADIIYFLTHQEKDSRIGNLSSIISVNSNGTAQYLKEGYVLVNALYKSCDIITNQPTILATGDIFGSVLSDNVIGVFPKNYSPENNGKIFGDMMNNYPVMKMLNTAYTLSSQLYGDYKPFNGAKQILSFEVSVDPENPFDCYNGNPLTPSPSCYITFEGNPIYTLPIHEMGHNFGASDFGSRGMRQLLYQNNKINGAGFGECVASLPVQYVSVEIFNNPEKYGFNKSSYEWNFWKNHMQGDIPFSSAVLTDFETLINNGGATGIFDEGIISLGNNKLDIDLGNGQILRRNGINVLCSFFQQYSYNFTNQTNPYGNEVIKRFLNLFGNNELPNFRDSEVETYFSAAYSAAVGDDMRNKLRFWGFTINDSYFEELYLPFRIQLASEVTCNLSSFRCSPVYNAIDKCVFYDDKVQWVLQSYCKNNETCNNAVCIPPKPKYILTCQKSSKYYKSWHTTPCSSYACGKDKYIGCEKKWMFKYYYREVCQSLTTYNTSCSETTTCGSDKEIKRTTCA